MSDWISLLTFASALGCGLIAGVFFAFSSFVMRALARLPPAQGVAAMQSINVAVINPIFLTVFLGMAAACLVLAVSSLLHGQRAGAPFLLAGSLCYLIGTMLVTIVFHIPWNNSLAAVEPSSPQAAAEWALYLVRWTFWNHVRGGAALAAAALLIVALRKSTC
jgi:uncharacterized membrane protein